jgi:hypothetical protein
MYNIVYCRLVTLLGRSKICDEIATQYHQHLPYLLIKIYANVIANRKLYSADQYVYIENKKSS